MLQKGMTGHMTIILVLLAFPGLVWSDPPPWAPAHGYYKDKGNGKGKGNRYGKKGKGTYSSTISSAAYDTGPYLGNGRCNRETVGKVVGTVVGGVLGANVGGGDGKKLATILGSVIGYVVGGNIGRYMDDADQLCTGQALEYAEDNRPVTWKNPDTGQDYTVTPTNTYKSGVWYCREFTTQASIGGQMEQTYGTACRQPDGSWQMVR